MAKNPTASRAKGTLFERLFPVPAPGDWSAADDAGAGLLVALGAESPPDSTIWFALTFLGAAPPHPEAWKLAGSLRSDADELRRRAGGDERIAAAIDLMRAAAVMLSDANARRRERALDRKRRQLAAQRANTYASGCMPEESIRAQARHVVTRIAYVLAAADEEFPPADFERYRNNISEIARCAIEPVWWLRRLEAFERASQRIADALANPDAYTPIPVPKWVRTEAVRLAGPLPLPEMSMMPGRVAFVGYGPAHAEFPASISVTWKALRAGRACVLAGLRWAFERHAEAEAARAALAS